MFSLPSLLDLTYSKLVLPEQGWKLWMPLLSLAKGLSSAEEH